MRTRIEEAPHAVLFGNLAEGFSITGPFPNRAAAVAWAKAQERFASSYDRWFATEIQDPEK